MRIYVFKPLLIACFLFTSFSGASQIHNSEPVPKELATEVLLFLKFDEIPLEGVEEQYLGNVKMHNSHVRQINKKIDKAVEDYPYPKKVMQRSEYTRMSTEDLPDHRFVLDSEIMQRFQTMRKFLEMPQDTKQFGCIPQTSTFMIGKMAPRTFYFTIGIQATNCCIFRT